MQPSLTEIQTKTMPFAPGSRPSRRAPHTLPALVRYAQRIAAA